MRLSDDSRIYALMPGCWSAGEYIWPACSPCVFANETSVPVLDPGCGKTKTGWIWTIARDDRL